MKTYIVGDRQSGKTELLLSLAERLIRQGQNVLYVAGGRQLATNSFYRVEASVLDLPGYKVYQSNGRERVTHKSGGELRFVPMSQIGLDNFRVDTLLLDDIHTDYEFYHPQARVVRAAL